MTETRERVCECTGPDGDDRPCGYLLAPGLSTCPDCVGCGRSRTKEDRINALPEWVEALTPQSCENSKHPDWFINSEHNHRCPWCEIFRLRIELERTEGDIGVAIREAAACREALRAAEPWFDLTTEEPDPTADQVRALIAAALDQRLAR